MDYIQTLTEIFAFSNFAPGTAAAKTIDLTRIEKLTAALGNPHHQFQSIHIAGTKGKGSTAAMIENVLRNDGYRTGLYTSPHLHTFRERIRVNGALISQADVIAGYAKIKPIIDTIPDIAAFEIITALAFDYFAQQQVEFAVIEVGLGGRLDATNIVIPRASVITSISYDHMAILGNTLTEIAREKAGIIKPNVPVISSPQSDEAMHVIAEIARDKNAPLVSVSPNLAFQVSGHKIQVTAQRQTLESQTFIIEASDLPPVTCNLRLLGHHQLTNAATALAALFTLREQGIRISDSAIVAGLASVEWRGRFEILARAPDTIVDGAHNADSARQLIAALHKYFPNARWHFIFAASGDKDIEGMFAEILPHAASLILTKYAGARSADLMRLSRLALPYNRSFSALFNLDDALQAARQNAAPDDVICITGSLFLVADAREMLLTEQAVQVEKD